VLPAIFQKYDIGKKITIYNIFLQITPNFTIHHSYWLKYILVMAAMLYFLAHNLVALQSQKYHCQYL